MVTDVTKLPFKSNTFDNMISIAVIHHLTSEERRIESIKEFLRVTKPNGKVLVLCWAFEQEKKFES